MSKSNTRQSFSRRKFIGASTALGLAGVSVAQLANANPPPDKFKGKKPLKPAPALAQAMRPMQRRRGRRRHDPLPSAVVLQDRSLDGVAGPAPQEPEQSVDRDREKVVLYREHVARNI